MNETARLKMLVEEYLDQKLCHDFDWFREAKNLSAAIERAGMSRNRNGKRHWHQRRLGEMTLRQFVSRLLNVKARISATKDFKSLHDIVAECRVNGVGHLAVYDVALRIGAHRGFKPEAVYLHAGTAKGLKRLAFLVTDKTLLKATRMRTVELGMLPSPLRRLEPWQIEDFLCRTLG